MRCLWQILYVVYLSIWASDVTDAVSLFHDLWNKLASYGVKHQTDDLQASLKRVIYRSPDSFLIFIGVDQHSNGFPHMNEPVHGSTLAPICLVQHVTLLRWFCNCSFSLQHPQNTFSRICTSYFCLWMKWWFLCINEVMLQLHHLLSFRFELNDGRQRCGFHKPPGHY